MADSVSSASSSSSNAPSGVAGGSLAAAPVAANSAPDMAAAGAPFLAAHNNNGGGGGSAPASTATASSGKRKAHKPAASQAPPAPVAGGGSERKERKGDSDDDNPQRQRPRTAAFGTAAALVGLSQADYEESLQAQREVEQRAMRDAVETCRSVAAEQARAREEQARARETMDRIAVQLTEVNRKMQLASTFASGSPATSPPASPLTPSAGASGVPVRSTPSLSLTHDEPISHEHDDEGELHGGDGTDRDEDAEDDEVEPEEKGYPYLSIPRYFPPDLLGYPVAPRADADAAAMADHATRLAQWATVLPAPSHKETKRLVKQYAHPNRVPFVAHVPSVLKVEKQDLARCRAADGMLVATEVVTKGMPAMIERGLDVLRMMSSLDAAALISTPHEMQEALLAMVRVHRANLEHAAELHRGWAELCAFQTRSSAPKAEDSTMSLHTAMLRSGAGAAASAAHAEKERVQSIFKGLPLSAHPTSSAWPMQNSLSFRRVMHTTDMPAGYGDDDGCSAPRESAPAYTKKPYGPSRPPSLPSSSPSGELTDLSLSLAAGQGGGGRGRGSSYSTRGSRGRGSRGTSSRGRGSTRGAHRGRGAGRGGAEVGSGKKSTAEASI